MISPFVFTVLRIVLITSLIILFLVIMYRNLLRKMKSRIPSDRFAFVEVTSTADHGCPQAVRIEMPEAGNVRFELMDAVGNSFELFEGRLEKGTHELAFRPHALQAGDYVLRCTTQNQRSDRRVVIGT